MEVIKLIGVAFISALITALAFMAGFVISVISTIVTTVFTVFLAFVGVFLLVTETREARKNKSS